MIAKIRLALLALAMALAAGTPAHAQGAGSAQDRIKGCEFCHGAGGDSSYALIPRINGQRFDYLMARLKEFGQVTPDTARGVATMSHAANVEEPLRAQIAGYFSRQAPAMPTHASPDWTLGQQIYRSGLAPSKVAACQTCHGPDGEGKGAAPRLAGQHASYLKTRLWILTRFNLPGNAGMHRNTVNMTGAEMDAVILYLAND